MHPNKIGQGDPPQGYANWKEWENEQVTRKQALAEIRDHFRYYHPRQVAPLHAHMAMPVSERFWERAKRWPERELVWPLNRPWWFERIAGWIGPKLAEAWERVRERVGLGESATPAAEPAD